MTLPNVAAAPVPSGPVRPAPNDLWTLVAASLARPDQRRGAQSARRAADDAGDMGKSAWVLALIATAATAAGCGEKKAERPLPRPESSRVALTVAYPGFAPWALITYQGGKGERCHALGQLTADGPQVIGDPAPLEEALVRRGRCLEDGNGRSVSLHVAPGANGDVRVVGGIAAKGVRRLVVGGRRVRPAASGAFLFTQPASARLGRSVEVVYRGGGRERVTLADLHRDDAS